MGPPMLLALLRCSLLFWPVYFPAYSAEPVNTKDSPPKYVIAQGSERELCRLLLRNLELAHAATPPVCELVIDPAMRKYFRQPDWKTLNPDAHLRWLWRMDTDARATDYFANKLQELIPYNRAGEDEVAFERWQAWFKGFKADNGFVVRLRQATFDFDGDGKPDTVVGYRVDQPCNPRRPEEPGDHLYRINPQTDDVIAAEFYSQLKHQRFVPILYVRQGARSAAETYLFYTAGFQMVKDWEKPAVFRSPRSLQLWAITNPSGHYISPVSRCIFRY